MKKGLYNTRMVYNGTGWGLNNSIWAPYFGVPIVRHKLCSMLPGYSQCNLAIGEMFLIFLLNDTVKEISGVDTKHVSQKAISDLEWEMGGPNDWERWCWNSMGLRDSPYRLIQLLVRLKIEAYVDRWDCSNTFHLERMIYNLPGTKGYRPGLP